MRVSAAVVFLAALGCGTTGTPPPTQTAATTGLLSGAVTYQDATTLPPNAKVNVRVWDALEPPGTALVGETSFAASGQLPAPFQLFYDPGLIQQTHVYGARATITVDGSVWFETDKPIPVLTQGAPSVDVQIPVQRVWVPGK